MLLAASSTFLTAAGVEMSGFGRPFGTPTAVRMFATTVALPGTIVTEAIAPGNGAMISETSRPWPFATVLLVSEPLPYVTLTLWPVFASKPATIVAVGTRMGPTASSVISPWARALVQPPSRRTMTTIADAAFFVLSMMAGSCLLNALVMLRRGARGDFHGLHLLDVLGVQGFLATQRGLGRDAVFGREVVEDVVLAGQETGYFARRDDRSVGSELTRERRDHLVGIVEPAGFANVRRRQVRGVVDDEDERQNIPIAMHARRHRGVGALRNSRAGQVRFLEMVGRVDQRVAFPVPGGKSRPLVRRVRRGMLPAIQVDHLFRLLPRHVKAQTNRPTRVVVQLRGNEDL